ncbi:hypothetical protein SAMN04487969_119102 [Paenibacillus algorifonticola]|uniref:Uncharacterized protein n=1 Tax=Paenibacillus algorifonticola TaxID=684063 RepID=A0A1I2GZU7_9BACL|nr:hypothetical protein [Paenibacillus algorifonticola]SFF23504.1 hypothetical protein SAMN04487969_119102 [Paenibacillus algorifonticola]
MRVPLAFQANSVGSIPITRLNVTKHEESLAACKAFFPFLKDDNF